MYDTHWSTLEIFKQYQRLRSYYIRYYDCSVHFVGHACDPRAWSDHLAIQELANDKDKALTSLSSRYRPAVIVEFTKRFENIPMLSMSRRTDFIYRKLGGCAVAY